MKNSFIHWRLSDNIKAASKCWNNVKTFPITRIQIHQETSIISGQTAKFCFDKALLYQPSYTDTNMLSCLHLKYMIIVKVGLRMVLICIILSNPTFSIDSNKLQIELKFYHQLLYWLKLVQCLEVTLILVLLKNSLNNCSIISKNCLVNTHVLLSFVTSISTIVWKIWLETDKAMTLSCYLVMTRYFLVRLMIPSWRTMTIKNDWIYIVLINFNLIRKMHNHSV